MTLYEDEYSLIGLDRDASVLTLTWLTSTASMDDAGFKQVYLIFAKLAEEHRSPRILVDVRDFHKQMTGALKEWRKAEIVPRYHLAGVERFAFVHEPDFKVKPAYQNEGENYLTGHFNSLEGAQQWLDESPAA